MISKKTFASDKTVNNGVYPFDFALHTRSRLTCSLTVWRIGKKGGRQLRIHFTARERMVIGVLPPMSIHSRFPDHYR